MSVTVRRYRRGCMVDINTRLPNGRRYRERKRLSVSSKSAAQRWGQDRERHLLQHGPPQPKKEVPTVKEFARGSLIAMRERTGRNQAGLPPRNCYFGYTSCPSWVTSC